MLRRTTRRDRMIGLFFAGLVLFDPPLLNLVGGTVWGWPALYVYLFSVWGVLIAAAAFILERSGGTTEERGGDDAPR